MPLPPQTRIGPYEVVAHIDEGGMGVVYRARDLRLDRDVALKMLPPSLNRDPEDLAGFEREAKLLAALNHPHIATIHGLETTAEGEHCIVLEFVEGETLAARLKHGPQPVLEALEIAKQVADALCAAHEQGVVHRDLKPGNVMITRTGWIKLLDFGLAKRTQDSRPPLALDLTVDMGARTMQGSGSAGTRDDVVVGTPGYMSPEQVLARPHDHRSDIFSFGCVLYECLTGMRAFRGGTFLEICAALVHAEPDWTLLPEDLPAGAHETLVACLAKDPDARPATMALVREGLSEVDSTTRRRRAEETLPAAIPNNLPSPVTSFIGREAETAECHRLLAQTRLLTLTGVGGCGKTRLALRVANDLLHEGYAGVWFVDLAPLDDAERVPLIVATALGVREEPNRTLTQTIVDTLRAKRAVLFLDNCEHLLAAVSSLVETLLRECGDLRLIATSREGLGVTGEQTYGVPSLGVPPRGGADTVATIGASEAVRLFVERASLVAPGFTLVESDASAIADVCRRLDGIPLAIELAAARVKVLTPSQIHAKLADRFRLLTGGSKTTLPRHQTLRATIQWSYDLLADLERELLRALSVFSGGWTLEAATAVSGENADEFEVLDLMTRLVDKSLVSVEHARVDTRYRMLETVRQYAQERALEAGETAALRTRHLAHFVAYAEGAYWKLWSPDQAVWVRRLEMDHENMLDALAWCDSVDDGADLALRLASSLRVFWDIRGHLAVGRHELRTALAREGAQAPTIARGRALYGAGWLAIRQGDFDAATARFTDALSVFEQIGEKRGLSAAWSGLATVARSVGQSDADFDLARTHYEKALAFSREINDTPSIAASLNNLGDVAMRRGDLAAARDLFAEADATYQKVGDKEYRSTALHNLAEVCMKQGDAQAARTALAQSFELASEVSGRSSLANALEYAAHLASMVGDGERAVRLLATADAHRDASGSPLTPSELAEHDAGIAVARAAVGEERFAELWSAARSSPVAPAVEEVRAWLANGA